MILHIEIPNKDLFKAIKQKQICFAGNRKLKIYGTLKCRSGKRMKRQNRVFFISQIEAIENGYRPCGHCILPDYKKWKSNISN